MFVLQECLLKDQLPFGKCLHEELEKGKQILLVNKHDCGSGGSSGGSSGNWTSKIIIVWLKSMTFSIIMFVGL